jgi:DEAD/DEAH box helicase domain-containing protein
MTSGSPERKGPTVVFDVETQNLFEEVGGRRNAHKLLISVAVSYDIERNEYRSFTEATVSELVEQLFGAGLVIGFNTIGFDYKVLRPYTDRRLNQLPTLDVFDHLYRRTGYRSRLDTIASETLGAHKSGSGKEAAAWFKAGQIDKLIAYCQDDVRITYELYRYGREHGAVYTRDSRGGRVRIPIMW